MPNVQTKTRSLYQLVEFSHLSEFNPSVGDVLAYSLVFVPQPPPLMPTAAFRWTYTNLHDFTNTYFYDKNEADALFVTRDQIFDLDGQLNPDLLPTLVITDTFVVSSQAEMLALIDAEKGDVAIRSDANRTFILQSSPASVLSNWKEILTPGGGVISVAGKVGAVTLNKSDVGLDNVSNDAQLKIASNLSDLSNLQTARANLGVYSILQVDSALLGKANTNHVHNADDVTAGIFHVDRIPTLAQSKITNLTTDLAGKAALSHTHSISQVTNLIQELDSKVSKPVFFVDGNIPIYNSNGALVDVGINQSSFASASHTHDASAITTGVFNTGRLGTGTANNTTFLRGDGTWAAPPASGGGTPGGTSGQLQWNNTNAFAGVPNSNVDAATGNVSIAQLIFDTNTGRIRFRTGANDFAVFQSLDLISTSHLFFATNREFVSGAWAYLPGTAARTGGSLQLENDRIRFYQFAANSLAGTLRWEINGTNMTFNGALTATSYTGSGASLTNIPQSAVTSLTTDLAARVPTSRTISTTAPLGGGGDLSVNRTLFFVNQNANTILAGPINGAAAAPNFRALVADDIPSNLNIQQSGALIGTRKIINFTGAGVTASDDAVNGRITVNIPGGGGSSSGTAGNVIRSTGSGPNLSTTEQQIGSVTITPSSTASKILVYARLDLVKDATTTIRQATIRVRRGTTNADPAIGADCILRSGNIASVAYHGPAVILTLDEPNTAGAVTYSLRGFVDVGNTTTPRFSLIAEEVPAKGEKGDSGVGPPLTFGVDNRPNLIPASSDLQMSLVASEDLKITDWWLIGNATGNVSVVIKKTSFSDADNNNEVTILTATLTNSKRVSASNLNIAVSKGEVLNFYYSSPSGLQWFVFNGRVERG